jgi:transcriptional regulator with XRE-family HTH domain
LTRRVFTVNNNSMKINKEVIGQRIKQALEKAGLTQRALASELGVSAGSVSGYVKGLNEPGVAALGKIADFCGVSLNWLITGEPFFGEKSGLAEKGTLSPENDTIDPRLSQLVIEKLKVEKPVGELQLTAMEEAVILMLRHLPEKERLHVLYSIMGAWVLAQKQK